MNVDEIKQAGALAAMRDAVDVRRTEIELLEAEIAKYTRRPAPLYGPLLEWLEQHKDEKYRVRIDGAALGALKDWQNRNQTPKIWPSFKPLDNTGEVFSVPPSAIDILVEALLPNASA